VILRHHLLLMRGKFYLKGALQNRFQLEFFVTFRRKDWILTRTKR
jgi:hypothetical protein